MTDANPTQTPDDGAQAPAMPAQGRTPGPHSPETEAALGAAVDTHSPEGQLAERLAQAEARVAEYHDMALRARAEMENLRKRNQLDVASAHKYANEGFAESLLPVRDSLEMALTVENPSLDNLREGVEATLRLLSAAFDRHKLLVIDPIGERFDPNRHQAISMVPAGDVPPNHVVSVLQKGYLINDRVLRPALVTVRTGS